MLRPVPFGGFGGGLNLRDQPDVVRQDQAVDLLNVVFTDVGAVKQRDGYAKLTSSAGANRYDSLTPFYKTDGTKQLVAGAGNRLEGINTSGALVASTATTASPHFFTRFGTPGSELVFCANGTDTVRQWNGTAFATPSYTGTTPTGRFLTVQASDNRLVCARPSSNASRVLFSDEGNPLAFQTNNYEDLTPGDGETIQGACAWGGHVFVFKESKFFVFYGTSVDGQGNPIFNYRPVNAGVGLASPRALAVARDGVYFLDRMGVYRTNGGTPELVSASIESFFRGGTSDFYLSKSLNHASITQASMTWHNERIYLAVPTGTSTANDRTLVLDPRYGWWTLYDIPASALATLRVSSQEELVFSYSSGTNHVGRHSSAYTDDDGVAMLSRWRSGWFDLGNPSVKTLREWKLWGKGIVKSGVAKDYATPLNAATVNFSTGLDLWGDGTGSDTWGSGSGPDTWGSGTSLAPRAVRYAVRGTTFSLALDSSSGSPWEVHRATLHVRETRPPSITKADSA